jgi:autotransporter-associated beta strand protein
MSVALLAHATPPPGYALVWSDEFNESSLNTAYWEYARNGWRNSAYDTPAAVSVAGGDLVITTYTSGGTNFTGFIDTQNHISAGYGYYEASIDFSNAPGQWSAFWIQSPWMMNVQPDGTLGNTNNNPTNGVEIDVFEHIDVTSSGSPYNNGGDSALWWNGYGSAEKGGEVYSSSDLGVGTGFHTYGFLWTSNSYTFYVDGNVTGRSTSGDMISSALQFIRLTSEIESNSWAGTVPPGGYPDQADSQVKMLVDYVRYYAPASANAALWTGAASTYWTNSANWVSNQLPAANSELMFTYQCSANYSMRLGQNTTANGLVFLPSTGAFSISDTNTLTLGAGGIDMSEADNNVTLNVPVNIAANQTWTVGLNNPGNTLTVNDSLSGSATLTKSSWGTLVLNGSNSFSGTLNVDTGSSSNNDGMVLIASASAVTNLGAIAIRDTALGTSALVLSNGVAVPCAVSLAGRNNSIVPIECIKGNGSLTGGLTLTGGGSNYVIESDGTLSLGGTISAGSGATGALTLILQGSGGFIIPGSIQNGNASSLSICKTNTGSLTLSGANTFSGGITNWHGTLFINGSTTCPLAVQGGILSGTGMIAGATTIQSLCELSPGAAIADSIGTLSFGGDLTLSSGSTTYMEINPGPPVTNDQINVAGTLNCGGTLYVGNLGGTFSAGQSFKLFNVGNWSGSFSTLTLPALSSGLAWNTNNLTNGILSVIGVSPAETLVVSNGLGGVQMQLNWSYGALQTATNVTGPYINVPGAVSPFIINATNAEQFYRIKEN